MLYFSVDATNSRKVMTRCVKFVTISSSISFGQPLSAVNIQQYTILPQLAFPYFFYSREHIDSHYADSCLSTIEYPSTQSIDKNTFSLLGLYENTLPNWFCFPDDAALSNGNGFVRCSAGGDVNELRERCRNLGQLAMIWNHGTTHIIIVETKFNL